MNEAADFFKKRDVWGVVRALSDADPNAPSDKGGSA
jgi:hypothetical protein